MLLLLVDAAKILAVKAAISMRFFDQVNKLVVRRNLRLILLSKKFLNLVKHTLKNF
jgi:hypothetical protein